MWVLLLEGAWCNQAVSKEREGEEETKFFFFLKRGRAKVVGEIFLGDVEMYMTFVLITADQTLHDQCTK